MLSLKTQASLRAAVENHCPQQVVVRWGWAPTGWVMLSKWLDLSGSQFLHLENEDSHSVFSCLGSLWGLNKFTNGNPYNNIRHLIMLCLLFWCYYSWVSGRGKVLIHIDWRARAQFVTSCKTVSSSQERQSSAPHDSNCSSFFSHPFILDPQDMS